MKLIRIYCHSDTKEKLAACSLPIHPELLALYEKLGLIEVKEGFVDYEDLQRLKRILRLKHNVGVNTIGASIIVDLLDKIEALQDEIEYLRRK